MVDKVGEEEEGEVGLVSRHLQNIPYLQGQERRKEEWVLVPTDVEEAGRDQLVDLVQGAEPLLAAAVAAHSFVPLTCLVVLFCFLLLIPIHRAAAAENLCAAAAGAGIGEVGYLQV